MLNRLKIGLVIDHVGKFLEPVTADHLGFRTLLRLVDKGAWVKLSAPYETSKSVRRITTMSAGSPRLLIKAAPERMLWATNWPHPTPGVPVPDDAWMLDMLLDWAPDEATRNRILVDNPARLYRF